MAIVGLAIAIPVTLMVREDGDGDSVRALEPIKAEEPKVGRVVHERDLDVKLRKPKGWDEKKRGEVLELASSDGAARVAISAPGPAADADRIHAEVLAGLRSTYRDVTVLDKKAKEPVGELKGRATAVSARVPGKNRGNELRILVSTARGKERAYVVVVFTQAEGASQSVLEAQALVNNLRFVN